MTYNKSEIMSKAWKLFKSGQCRNFATALRQAWLEAKRERTNRENGMVKASELVVGDTIAIEYGDYGNFTTCTITEIANELFMGKYISIKATSARNSNIEFNAEPDKMYKKEQVTAVEIKIAA